jgi:hypothetical protein
MYTFIIYIIYMIYIYTQLYTHIRHIYIVCTWLYVSCMYAQIIATIRCFYRSWLRWLLDSSSVLQPRICDRWSLYQTLNSRHHGTWFRMIPNESMILMQWLVGQAPSHSHSSPAGIGCILCFQLSRRSSSMMDSFLMTRRRLQCFGQDMHEIHGGAASHL